MPFGQTLNKPLPILRTTTALGASVTSNLVPSWPCLGWSTCRLYCESDVAFTVNFRQSESAGTKRTTNSVSVAAATGTVLEFTIASDECAIQIVNGGSAMNRFVITASLQP